MGSGGTTALRPPGKFCFIRPLLRSDLICIRLKIFSHPPKHLRRCKVKPHGSLVPVSSTHRCAYTPAYQRRRLQRSFRTLKESGRTHLGASFVLRCFQHLSLPHLATGSAIGMTTRTPVMRPLRSSRTRSSPLSSPAPTADRDRTVSRRSKPSSRTTLNGEQPYPWDLLQPQDVMSRHRGAKHRRRYELLGGISLLSPEYLLSVERWPFHSEPPDHYDLLSHLLAPSRSQSSWLMPLH